MYKYIEYIHKSRITGSKIICICDFDKCCQIVLHKGHSNSHSPQECKLLASQEPCQSTKQPKHFLLQFSLAPSYTPDSGTEGLHTIVDG